MSKKINFFTPVSVANQDAKILSKSKILTLGSCFSDNIGKKLSIHLFDTLVNPFGTIFNPVSISKILDIVISNKVVNIEALNTIGSRFFHYDFHSCFDNTNADKVVKDINEKLLVTREFLERADFLIVTFGTSIVYRLKSEDRIVSNCHKVPNKNFSKEFLSVDFMEAEMNTLLNAIKKVNSNIKVILTVSPVRHTKEGMIENSLSKSRLIDLCHRLALNNDNIYYFPAYEIMMDELRDYRFYGPDLIHPNEQAIEVIWNRFIESYFEKEAARKVADIGDLNLAKNHIPFDPLSSEHLKFKQNQLNKLDRLKIKYPEIDLQEYVQFFQS